MSRASRSSGKRKPKLIVDVVTSKRLGKVRQHGTVAELTVRKFLHQLGLRYRIHNRDLPGSPDVANRSRKWAIFVHGCFWHRHRGCKRATTPTRNRQFWLEKFEANAQRDQRVQRALRKLGWRVVVIWECESENSRRLKELCRVLEAL